MDVRRRRPGAGRPGDVGALGGLFLALVLSACAGSTAPAPTGELRLSFTDDPGGVELASLVHHKRFGDNYFHGVLTGSVSISLSPDGVTWVEGLAPSSAEIALQDSEGPTRLVRPDAPAGSYRYVRLHLREASVLLQPGAEIGGLELTDSELVPLEGGRAAVFEFEVSPLTIVEGGSVELSFDLNAERWVIEDHLVAGTIPAEAVARSIAVAATSPAASASSRRLVCADTDEAPLGEATSTTDWGYLRLRRTKYSPEELAQWRRRIEAAGWERAFVFFKHEDEGRGPRLARAFLDADPSH